MNGIRFRPMQRDDVERVAELERICFQTPWSRDALKGELKNSVSHYLVGELDGLVIAYGGMWVLYDEAHVTNVAVAPEYRCHGLGTKLMVCLMRQALLYGAHLMTLEVRENNLKAQELYRKLGFTVEGRRKGYYSDTGEDALIMWNHDIAAFSAHSPHD